MIIPSGMIITIDDLKGRLEQDYWMKMKWKLFVIIILVIVWFSLPFWNEIIEFLFS